MNWIRKEDHVQDPVRPSGRVGYGGASRHIVIADALDESDVEGGIDKFPSEEGLLDNC